eukprot:GFUD01030312.1.p1 GENE.GFUD01030312.1~~GFUD01030312.1.p1  ORF type:complete len:446 (+),score=110.18 GFUD01030312.1:430-1767(+)
MAMNGPEEDRNLVPDQEEGGSSLLATTANYVNSIIGSGMIGIPFALKEAGFGLGLILLVVVGILTDYSLRLMVRAGTLSGTSSYQGIMEASFGMPGYVILSTIQFIYPFIAMVSYNIICGDTLTKLLGAFSSSDPAAARARLATSVLASRPFIIIVSTLLVTLPLSLYRDITKLAKASLLAIVFIVFILISITIRLFTLGPSIPASPDAWAFTHSGIPKAIGIMAFAYMCHHNTFLLYSAMKERTEVAWTKATHISVSISCLVIMICAVAGYITFTGFTQGDLLENYCWDDTLMNISRLLFCFVILLTYPIECFVCREVLSNIIWKDSKNSGWFRHFSVTLGLVMSSCLVSMSTDCLGIVLELNGILAAVPLAFILPPLCYLKLQSKPWLGWSQAPALAMAGFGILVATCGLGLLILQGVPSCSHGANPCYSRNSTFVYNTTILR